MGLDYGELDILRNNLDGRIYVVDVNKTLWGPPQFNFKRPEKNGNSKNKSMLCRSVSCIIHSAEFE